ncbi:hypothetical protein PS623_04663 [Pseudomonas fluorescens]|nr:hypothetical protein PS623_04663 [Pseudomonas fluorescens]
MGQAVGTPVELAIAETLAIEDQCLPLWPGAGHGADTQVYRRFGEAWPVVAQRSALRFGQQFDAGQGALGVDHEGGQQLQQMTIETLDGDAGKRCAVVAVADTQTAFGCNCHGQRIVGPFAAGDVAKAHAALGLLAQCLGHGIVVEHQQAVEQCLAAGAGPALDIVKRRVLELTQGEVFGLDAVQPVADALACLRGGNDRQSVDEQPDLLLDPRQLCRPPGHRGAKGHAGLAGIALQQQQPGRLHQGVDGDFLLPGKRLQVLAVGFVPVMVKLAMTTRTRAPGQATGQPGRLVQGRQALAPEAFAGGAVLALQPADVVAITTRLTSRLQAVIALHHFAHQLRTAPAVHQDVMVGVDQVLLVAAQLQQEQTQQWRLIKARTGLPLGSGQCLQIHALAIEHLQRQLDLTMDNLHRLTQLALPVEGRAQDVVGCNCIRPRLAETLGVEASHRHLQLIDVVVRGLLVEGVKEHALLHRRQRIEVGDGPWCYRQGVQLGLLERRQREVGRRYSAVCQLAAVFDQRQQGRLIVVGQPLHRGIVEHLAAEAPAQRQLAAVDLAVEGQPIAQRRTAVALVPGVFRCRRKQRMLVEALVELAQVVEGDRRFRHCRQRGAADIVTEMTQHTEAQTIARHLAQLLLDCLDRTGDIVGWGQTHGVQAGEPANRA